MDVPADEVTQAMDIPADEATTLADAAGDEGTPEGTYIGMVRHNVGLIAAGLR